MATSNIKTIYLVEDLEFKNNFEGLSLYKVGYTKRSLFCRIRGLQNWTKLRILYSTTDKEVDENELREKIKSYINGFKCFNGWKYLDSITNSLNPNIAEYLKNKYIPEAGTEFSKFGGGLTEYFIGNDWEDFSEYSGGLIGDINKYLKSELGIEENENIIEQVRSIEEHQNKQKQINYEKIL